MPLNDYIVQTDIEDRLSASVVQSIYDDANVGSPSANPIARLIKDACSKVNGYLFTMYAAHMSDDTIWHSPYPDEVVRLTLDVVVAMAAQRHPEAVKRAWQPLMEHVEKELDDLRKGKTRLNLPTRPPEPAANSGSTFRNGTTVNPTVPVDRFFADGTEDF